MATRKAARKSVSRSEPAKGYTEDTETFSDATVYRCGTCPFDTTYESRIVGHVAAHLGMPVVESLDLKQSETSVEGN